MQPVQSQQHSLLMELQQQQQQHGDAMDLDMPALARLQMMQQVCSSLQHPADQLQAFIHACTKAESMGLFDSNLIRHSSVYAYRAVVHQPDS